MLRHELLKSKHCSHLHLRLPGNPTTKPSSSSSSLFCLGSSVSSSSSLLSPLQNRPFHNPPTLKMRIPYVANPPPTTTDEEAAIVQRVAARRHPRPLQPLDLALLHAPPVADGWNAFLGAVRTRTTLPDALRELAICRVAVCNSAWYEWGHHAPLAAAAGLGARALEVVKKSDLESISEEENRNAAEDGLGEKEWAVLRYTDEMTRLVRVSDETFAALRKVCDEREVVEVTATVAAYNCVSRFLVALDVGERNATGPDNVKH